jgi:hypothetical protein
MKVTTAEAEWALEWLVARVAEFRQLARRCRDAARPRQAHASRMRTHDANALVDLVTIAESFFCVDRPVQVSAVAQDDLLTWAKRKKA